MEINAEQFETLSAGRRDAFTARVIRFLRDELPDFASRGTEAQLARLVAHAQDRARAYGFVTEQQIVCYLLLISVWGPRFDEDPRHAEAHKLLRDTQASAGARMEFLLAMAQEPAALV